MKWAYHATAPEDLASILSVGLLPQDQRHVDEDRAVDGPAVFFCPSPNLASRWNEIVLRFPWPADAEPDPYSDSMLVGGALTYTNWFTRTSVPAEFLAVAENQEA